MATVVNGHIIHDDYLVDDVEAATAFTRLDKFFNVNGQVYAISVSDVERSIRITRCCLKLIATVSEKNKTWLIEFAPKLPEIKAAFQLDVEKTNLIKELITVYVESQLVSKVLAEVSMYLTPARHLVKENAKSNRCAKKVCTLLVNLYEDLPAKIQGDVIQIDALFSMNHPDDLKKENKYKELKAIFDEVPKKDAVQKFVPIDLSSDEDDVDSIGKISRVLKKLRRVTENELKEESFHKTSCALSESQEDHLETMLVARDSIQEARIAKINDFVIRCTTHFYDEFVFCKPRSNPVACIFNKRFATIFPQISRQLFFQQSRLLSRIEKQLIVDTVSAFAAFIQDFSDACNSSNNVTKAMYSKVRNRLALSVDQPFGPEVLQEHFLKQIEIIVERLTWDDDDQEGLASLQNQTFQTLIASPIVEALNRFTQPDVLAFAIHQVLTGKVWDIPTPQDEPPLSAYQANDTAFSEELGGKILALCEKFLRFGKASGAVKLGAQLIMSFLKRKKTFVGSLIQKKLTQVVSAECLIEPIRFLDLLLFEEKDGERVPAITPFFAQTAEERQRFRKQLRQDIEGRHLPDIINRIKQMNRSSSFALNCESTKAFYQTVTDRIWTLIDNEALLKALAFYLLDGVQKSLKTEYRRKQHDRHYGAVSSTSSKVVERKD